MTSIANKEADLGDILTCAPSLGPVSELPSLCDVIIASETAQDERETALESILARLDEYLPQPALLDSVLATIVRTLTTEDAINYAAFDALVACYGDETAVYNQKAHAPFVVLCAVHKVRGKAVSRHYPHEAADFRRVLKFALYASKHLTDTVYWRVHTVIWYWASNVATMPFPLKSLAPAEDVEQLAEAVRNQLSSAPSTARAAALALARLGTRTDAAHVLKRTMEYCSEIMDDGNIRNRSGALVFLCVAFKIGRRDVLLPHVDSTLDIASQVAEGSPPTTDLHLATKLMQRVALVRLPPRTRVRYRKTKLGLFGSELSTESDIRDAEQQEDIGLTEADAECAERALALVLESLEHRDVVVRWSAAKGVGRLCERLPEVLADEVRAHVLDSLSDGTVESTHGACLALAELLRRALVPKSQLGGLVKPVARAAALDVRRDRNSVGEHVRDAACYVVWALARAYDTEALGEVAPHIARVMLKTALTDREIHCRRAAAAALQELVGRVDANDLKHGVFLVNRVQFFALADRNAAFKQIAIDVAAHGDGTYFDTVRDALVVQTRNWDQNIRALAADAVARLTPFDRSQSIVRNVLPKLATTAANDPDALHRHGAILALSAILATKHAPDFAEERGRELLALPAVYHNGNFFRGRTAPLLQIALCRLIAVLSTVAPSQLRGQGLDDAVNFLETCAASDPYVLPAAAAAFQPLSSILAERTDIAKNLQTRIVNALAEDNLQRARGQATIVGYLGQQAGVRVVQAVLNAALNVADVEVRRNSVRTLGQLCDSATITQALVEDVGEVFVRGMADYTVDDRGDIGSWVREAAMDASPRLVRACKVNDELLRSLLAGITRQVVERIDRTRFIAGMSLNALYQAVASSSSECATAVREVAETMGVYQPDIKHVTVVETLTGIEDAFVRGAKLLSSKHATVSEAALRGLVAAAGGMGHQAGAATTALLANPPAASRITALLSDDRLVVPALHVLTRLARAPTATKSGVTPKLATSVRAAWRGRMRDVPRMTAAVASLAELSSATAPNPPSIETSGVALSALALVLGAALPRLRRVAADALYIALVECQHFTSGAQAAALGDALALLADTPWTGLPVPQARSTRDKLCAMVGL